MDALADFAILDHIAASVFALEPDANGAPVYVAFNAHARRQSGRPLSDFIGRTARQIYPGREGEAAYAHHVDGLTLATPLTYQVALPIANQRRQIRTTLRPQIDETGQTIRLIGTSRDITADENARQARVELNTLSTEMEHFVALTAHDLRAPMRSMAALVDLMRQELNQPQEPVAELLNMMENITTKSMDLITDVLSRASTITSTESETVFSFPALCHDILETLDPRGGHRVKTSTSTVRADRSVMQVALRNLTENALKHGGRKTLSLDITVQMGMPGMLDLTLIDDGQGFSDTALKVMNGGRFMAESGYGLFGIKRLISARGGTLVARNLPDGKGAVARFSMPGQVMRTPTTAATDRIQNATAPLQVEDRPQFRA